MSTIFDRIRKDDPDWSPHDVLYPALLIVGLVAVLFLLWWLGVG